MKRLILMISSVAVVAIALGALAYSTFAKTHLGATPWTEPASIDDVVDSVLADREAKIEEGVDVDFGDERQINVLVLGLDSRKANVEPHCDAIHMFTLDLQDWTIHITSVPRGTYAYIPPGTYADNEYYLANACSFAGLDYGIEQIEKVVGVKADYVATVGFSQVLGIMRILDLPTTESLQWLRHRQSYAIGDPQRSHNQALFMKDLIVNQANKLRSDVGPALEYVLYTVIDTDMDYATARALVQGYLDANIDQRPDDITLTMKPYHETQDLHLNFDDPHDQVQPLLDYLIPYLSKEDLSQRTIEDVQGELVQYMNDRLDSSEPVSDIVEKQLWLQVEDHDTREQMHYDFISRYAQEIVDDQPDEAFDVISDYIFEEQTIGETDYADLGKQLLTELIRVEI